MTRASKSIADCMVQAAGESLVLMPERAVYWPRRHTLFVADVHFGKAAAFRAHAVPMPEGSMRDDLARLTHAIERVDAQRIILLGDVLHAAHGRAEEIMAQVAAWRAAHAHRQCWVVRGNHDRHAGDPPADWRMACVDEPQVEGPFIMRHIPALSDEGYVLAGHCHPVVHVRGRGKLHARLPCFVVGLRRLLLPAFAGLTGGGSFAREAGDRIFGIAEGEVIEVR